MAGDDHYTRPCADSAALVLIDVQRDFYADDAPMRVEGTSAALGAMAELARAFRRRELPIVHVVRLYRADGSNADPVRRRFIEDGARVAVPGSSGSQIAPELLPKAVELDHQLLLSGGFQQIGPAEHVMYKPRWGSLLRHQARAAFARKRHGHTGFRGLQFPQLSPHVDLRGVRTRLSHRAGDRRHLGFVRPRRPGMPGHRGGGARHRADAGLARRVAAG